MIDTVIRRAVNAVGIDIHKYSKMEWRWSYDVDNYYPVDPIPRWGHGKPPHRQISEILNSRRSNILALVRRFSQCIEILASVPQGYPNSNSPFWKNGWLENFDAAALVGMLVCNAPSRYFEIGSGNSTKFARYARLASGNRFSPTSALERTIW